MSPGASVPPVHVTRAATDIHLENATVVSKRPEPDTHKLLFSFNLLHIAVIRKQISIGSEVPEAEVYN